MSLLVPEPTAPEASIERCCSDGVVVMFATDTECLVEFVAGGGRLMRVRAFCLGCGQIAQPKVPARAHVARSVLEAAQLRSRRVAAARGKIGVAGDAASLGLPRWLELGDYVDVAHVMRGCLWEDYDAPAFRNPEIRKLRMKNLVHFPRSGAPRILAPPAGAEAQAPIYIDAQTIGHVLSPDKLHRQDADHLSFWPLTCATIERPIEAWMQTDRSHVSIAFLSAYRVGTHVRNHVAIVKYSTGWVVTTYALNSPERAEHVRTGRLLYAAYATP